MPYDPTFPPPGAPLQSAQFREQFQSLAALISAITTVNAAQVDGVTTVNPGDPATVNLSVSGSTLHFSFGIPRGNDGSNGTNGGDGAPGTPFTNFIVDGVTTLNPGEPATVSASFDGSAVRLSFAIPRGSDGSNGTNGSNGSDGGQGPAFTNFIVDGVNMLNPTDPASVQTTFDGSAVRMIFNLPRGFTGNDGGTGAQGGTGPQGPPFANAVVDGVTTLNPGDNATVQTSFDGSNVRFQFGIPRGNDGGSGPQGQPGEVSNLQLQAAINGTSNISNAVSTLDTAFADPDTESLRQAFNALVLALRR